MSDERREGRGPRAIGPGALLNGDYRLEALLDSGGMGHVYRARNVHAQVLAAIKVIDPRYTRDEDARAKFLAEAAALAGLQHDAIVRYQTLSYSEEYDCYFLVMELLEGEPLDRFLEHRHRLDLPDMRQFKRRVALGLHAAHEMGVIHRDVSPDNIFLVGGRVEGAKIIDFGIALGERAANRGADGGFVGKLDFASPEQLDSAARKIDRRADIYSLGLVFYAALTGKPLEMGGASGDIDEARALREAVPDLTPVDPAYRPLIAWMLQPDAGDRPMTMRVVADWEPERPGRAGRRLFRRRKAAGKAATGSGPGAAFLAWAGGAILFAGAAATTAAAFWDFGSAPLWHPADLDGGDALASEEAAERKRIQDEAQVADRAEPPPAAASVVERPAPFATGDVTPEPASPVADTSASGELGQEIPQPPTMPPDAVIRPVEAPAPEEVKPAETTVASIDVPPDPSAAPAVPPEPPLESLATRIQARLKQLGCYKGAVDGHFGAGSRASVEAFYRAAAVQTVGTDPTDELLALLMAQPSGIVCKPKPRPVGQPPEAAPEVARPPAPPAGPTPPTPVRVIEEPPAAPPPSPAPRSPAPPSPSPSLPPSVPDFLPPSQ